MGYISRLRRMVLFGLWACSTAIQAQPNPLPVTGSPPPAAPPDSLSTPLSLALASSLDGMDSDVGTTENSRIKQTADRILPLNVVINGSESGTWLLLERGREMYAPSDAFDEWRVQLPPDAKPIDFKLHGQTYWPLSAIPGYRLKLDFANQSVELLFPPQVFAATRLTQEKSKKPVVTPVLPSLFLNYDFNYLTSAQRNAAIAKDLGLLTEIGASNSVGVLTSSQVGRNLTKDLASGNPYGWIRLETTFTRDISEENKTLRLGDTSTRAGMWGRNVYFGGIQFGSNFALTPGFISNPIPTVTGISTAPSTVEMYVNGVLRQVSNVPTGPFTVDNAPLLTGNGDVRMVVRDILGRETVIEQSFFTTTQLLVAGLNDWSIEAGAVRNDMGIASNRYGAGFASGTWRHGYTNDLTLEGRAEATSRLGTIGLGLVSTLPGQMLGKASLAMSSGQNQNGELWLLGMEYQRPYSNLSIQVQGASRNFHQLGQAIATAPVKLQLAANWSYFTENAGQFGVGLANISQFDNTRVSTVSANYSTVIGERNSLSFTASRAMYGANSTSFGMFFVMPLGNNRVVSVSANRQNGQLNNYVSATQNPDQENHLGWRALAGKQQGQTHEEAGFYYLGRYGQMSGDVSASNGRNALRLGANGGLVLADNNLFVTERVDQSLALVEVAGYDNIGVGLGSTMLAHTNAHGVALIPRLMPYQNNYIRLSADDLPVSAEIENIEKYAVPAWRSAVKVVFPVRGGRGALLKIILDDGEAAPAGAIVQIEGDKEEFYVARRGEAFVTGLQLINHVLLKWKSQQCKFDVTLPHESPDDIPRLGPLPCKGITR